MNEKPLNEYAWLVDKVRVLEKQIGIQRALDGALDDMPDDYVLKPFLLANRVEVKKMLLTEYDERMTMEMFKEEGRAEGRAEGRVEGRSIGLVEGYLNSLIDTVRNLKSRMGMSDGQIREVLDISDEDWARIAARI